MTGYEVGAIVAASVRERLFNVAKKSEKPFDLVLVR